MSSHHRHFVIASYVSLLFFGSVFLLDISKDFYELFDISRDADDRTIRRAFKKLAIQFHPDKNMDDPLAHEKFVRINRAYEILKDEELRKKYDQYGEDGLDNANRQHPQYQSWQFYRDQFGIYDDDTEISTLNAHDFESQVLNGRRRWFVNFYSAQCSHCHELAPTWRQFARHVEGVIGVGAVNCLDAFFLCQQQGVGYYPMLIMYPERERYDGSRDVDALVDYVLSKLDSDDLELTENNFDDVVASNRGKPWIIDFCQDDSEPLPVDCLSGRSQKLLSASFEQSVVVGTISCQIEGKLCERLAQTKGIYFFPADSLGESHGERIQSLDSKEIVSLVLKKMPDFTKIHDEQMKEMIETGKYNGETNPWLVRFTKHGSTEYLEHRLISSKLTGSDIKIGQFNCSEYGETCQQLQLKTYPSFIMFKPEIGFEIYYGKPTLHDVITFAQESAHANVKTLSAVEFSSILASRDSSVPWFIDFFAPWCPPCMRLLPEFRRAAKAFSDKSESIHFGTVDCTVNNQACLAANVHSYPTSILYNGTKMDIFVGFHNTQELLDFIEDIRNPPVISLTPETFQDRVINRKDDEIWLVDFFSPHCAPCQQLAPEIRKLAKLFREYPLVFIADLDCAWFTKHCQQQHIPAYPTIRLFPLNKGSAVDYNSWFRDVMSMRSWLFASLPSRVTDLKVEDFYDILNSDEPWLVDFFAPWCGHCQVFSPEYEKVAEALEGRVHVGKINCDTHTHACQSAAVRAYPTVRFYTGIRGTEDSQSAYGTEINSQDSQQIVHLVENYLEQYKPKMEGELPKRDEL